MAKRSITDEEIGLIKAMLRMEMKNKDIQFYFNRQDRAVNSGRITGIRDLSYGPEVARASEDEAKAFMASFTPSGIVSPLFISEQSFTGPVDPIADKTLRSFFEKGSDGVWRCTAGETDEFECKENFNLRGFGRPLKTIAGFANHRGGYLFFGVKDKPDGFAVCGLNDDRFTRTDQNKFSQTIRAALEPTPRFRVAMLQLDSMTVGVIHVEAHSSKPVIAGKTEGDLVEGFIYYRYPGETRAICYADLRAILDERDRQSRESIMPMVQRLLELGPQDAMVANLAEGQLEGGHRPIIIDQQLVERIKFIRNGEFNEQDGAETLRLVGNVNAVDLSSVTTIKTVRTELTEESIVRNFIGRVLVEEPLAYVRQASHEQSFLLPLFYYLHLAGQSRQGAIADLKAHRNAKPNTAKEIIRRLNGERTLFAQASGKRLVTLTQIREQAVGDITTVAQAKAVMDAMTGLKVADSAIFEYAIGLIIQALELWDEDRSLISYLRKAASRLDELIYGPQVLAT